MNHKWLLVSILMVISIMGGCHCDPRSDFHLVKSELAIIEPASKFAFEDFSIDVVNVRCSGPTYRCWGALSSSPMTVISSLLVNWEGELVDVPGDFLQDLGNVVLESVDVHGNRVTCRSVRGRIVKAKACLEIEFIGGDGIFAYCATIEVCRIGNGRFRFSRSVEFGGQTFE